MRACKDTHLAAAFEDEKAIALGEISRTERDREREEAKRFRAVCRAEYGNEPESLNQYLSAVHTSGGFGAALSALTDLFLMTPSSIQHVAAPRCWTAIHP